MSWLIDPIKEGWVTVGTSVALLIVWTGFLTTGPLATLKAQTGSGPPEGTPSYDAQKLLSYLGRVRDGLRTYRRALVLDIPFAIVYGIALVILLRGTMGLWLPDLGRWFLLLPLIAALADVVEDLLLLWAVTGTSAKPSIRSPSIVRWARVATSFKFTAVLVAAMLILVGAVALGVTGIRSTQVEQSLAFPWALLPLPVLLPVYSFLLARWHCPNLWQQTMTAVINLIVAGLVLFLVARSLGVEPSQLGRAGSLSRTFGWAVVTVAILAYGLLVARVFEVSQRDQCIERLRPRDLGIKLGLILLGTAVPEEVLFRGVLFGAFEDEFSTFWGIIASSAIFGLWHVGPELQRLRANTSSEKKVSMLMTVPAVAFTAVAGALLCGVRISSKNLWAPVLVHWLSNAGGLLIVWISYKRQAETLA